VVLSPRPLGVRGLLDLRTLTLLVVGSAAVGLVAALSTVAGVPWILSPAPVTTFFLLVSLDGPWWLTTGVLPAGIAFIVLSVVTLGGRAGLNLLGLAAAAGTLGSLAWFGIMLGDGLRAQGVAYYVLMLLANGSALAAIWTLWARCRHGAGSRERFALALVFCLWLFGFAFPWLGELI